MIGPADYFCWAYFLVHLEEISIISKSVGEKYLEKRECYITGCWFCEHSREEIQECRKKIYLLLQVNLLMY